MQITDHRYLKLLVCLLSVYFLFFTFYKLPWSEPFFFHPDERNIASSVSQLDFPKNLNPHFFAYGALPIYLVYFLGLLFNSIQNQVLNTQVSFGNAILIGRFISALLTIGVTFLIYKISKTVGGSKVAYISLVLALTSTAFFQFSHFSTFEMWLSFFSLLSVFFLIKFLDTSKVKYIVYVGILFGLLNALKLSSVIFVIVPIYIILVDVFLKNHSNKLIRFLKLTALFIYLSIIAYILCAPFNLIDYDAFMSSMKYEGGVATGTLPVFYTGSFYNSVPILFQFEKILPFLINPLNTALIVPAIVYSFYTIFKRRDQKIIIILLSFFVLFISGSVLFAKWTRYVVPSIPFLYILIAFFLGAILKKKYFVLAAFILASAGIIFSFSFIKTVRIDLDTRISGVEFAKNNIPLDSFITSEVYDLGIVPFNRSDNIVLFNFYDLDNGASQDELSKLLTTGDYIILPSQRIYKSRLLHSSKFPNGNSFYKNLFEEKLGYKKIYETPCDLFCRITYLGNPVFSVEETSNVFDRPTLFIFKKLNKL